MPRKPSLPPTIFKLESLSTGKAIWPPAGVDDFTGQPIELVQDDSPEIEQPGAQELQDIEHRARHATERAWLEEQRKPKPVQPIAPRVAGKRVSFKGDNIALYDNLPPWRRT